MSKCEKCGSCGDPDCGCGVDCEGGEGCAYLIMFKPKDALRKVYDAAAQFVHEYENEGLIKTAYEDLKSEIKKTG